ncbi:unnamed protein product [Protopolystoma xenopodis]|uniref:Uncharacterized protein n=1 Tax=Protopolystoma xenopodis TaxID=117903 RepID=A0A3S5CJ39_9PLAT|nr:unnamed protein product [Protopolystoma xenopodis]
MQRRAAAASSSASLISQRQTNLHAHSHQTNLGNRATPLSSSPPFSFKNQDIIIHQRSCQHYTGNNNEMNRIPDVTYNQIGKQTGLITRLTQALRRKCQPSSETS